VYKISRPRIYAILALSVLIDITIGKRLEIFYARPDFTLICVVFFGLFFGEAFGLESGLAAGLLEDIFCLDFFGINTTALGLTGFAAGLLETKFFKESRMTQFTLMLFFTALSMTVHFIIVLFLSKQLSLDFLEYLSSSIIPSCLYTSLVSVPIFSKFINVFNLKEMEDLL
jgi:rod shape-determining protein MreD